MRKLIIFAAAITAYCAAIVRFTEPEYSCSDGESGDIH